MTHPRYELKPGVFALQNIIDAIRSSDLEKVQDVTLFLKSVEKQRPADHAKLSVDLQTFQKIKEIAYLDRLASDNKKQLDNLKKIQRRKNSESCKCTIS